MSRCVSTSEGTIDVAPIPSTWWWWWWCECQSDQRLRFFFGRVDVPCFLACSLLLSSILTTSPVNLHIPASLQATSTPRRYDARASMLCLTTACRTLGRNRSSDCRIYPAVSSAAKHRCDAAVYSSCGQRLAINCCYRRVPTVK